MTLSDSDDVQTISSGSEDNKEKEKVTPGKERRKEEGSNVKTPLGFDTESCCFCFVTSLFLLRCA